MVNLLTKLQDSLQELVFGKRFGEIFLAADHAPRALSNTPSLDDSMTTGVSAKRALRLMMAQVW